MFDMIIIDSNNLGYMAYHSIPKDLSDGQIKTSILYGFLNSIQFLANKFQCKNIIFVWDSKYSYRKLIFPGYKKRDKNDDVFNIFDQFDRLKKNVLPSIGFKNIFEQTGIEADDIIAKICKSKKYKNKLIVSTDKDLYQLLNKKTTIWNSKKQKTFGKNDFVNEYKIKPKQYALVKAIAGCTSDKIKGINNVGEKTACKYIIDEYSITDSKRRAIKINKEIIEFNKKLVILPHEKTEKVKIKKEEFKIKDFIDVFSMYNFESFLMNMKRWRIFYD